MSQLDWQKAYQNRDVGWLLFNQRVLAEALDERTPLLERLKFLAIFTSNLDEFFMKRVGILKQRMDKVMQKSHSIKAQEAEQHLRTLREIVLPMLRQQADCFKTLLPRLAEQGIHLLSCAQLTPAQKEEADQFFSSNVSPALTPLALDPGHPFPYLSNLSTSLGFVLRYPEAEENVFARVKVPSILPQWVRLKSDCSPSERVYVRLHELIQDNAASLFPGMILEGVTLFRVARNAEVDLDEEEAESLKALVAEELRQRRFEPVVRLEIQEGPNPWVRQLLMQKFELTELDLYEMPGELDFTGLFPIADLDRIELRDEPWTPVTPPNLTERHLDIFSAIRAGDLLVHHPFESFDASVEHFIRSAAKDPHVVAIKMTVYRVGDDTPFVRSLIQAAESGKQVACLIELQARFDEARNLHWAQELEKVGAHVVHGVIGLKTHSKIALVVREEQSKLRCYTHIGTGNYHIKTAKLYTDVGLFTVDESITRDVVTLFHYLTGCSQQPPFSKLLVAPINMRQRFEEMIARELKHQKAGRPALILAKMNQLEDPSMCEALCRASQAGVKIELIVRGFSCLIPGVKKLTKNVRIFSVIGRFLEHSRIFYFANGQEDPLEGEFYIGSADWMYRNLSKRVEAIVPIESRALRERLWEILTVLREDRRQSWEMQSDGTYQQHQPSAKDKGAALVGTHQYLMDLTRRRNEEHVLGHGQ